MLNKILLKMQKKNLKNLVLFTWKSLQKLDKISNNFSNNLHTQYVELVLHLLLHPQNKKHKNSNHSRLQQRVVQAISLNIRMLKVLI